jgi:hypothetical protein
MPPGIFPWGIASISLPRSLTGTVYVMQSNVICQSSVGDAIFSCSPSTRWAPTTNLWAYAAEVGANVEPGQTTDEPFDISPTDSNTLIFGADYGELLKTTDKGVTSVTVRRYQGPTFSTGYERRKRTVNYSKINSNIVFASGAEGVLRSMDGGNTWTLVDGSGSVEKLAIDKTGQTIVAMRSTELRYSKDAGNTWQTLPGVFGYSISASPIEARVFFTTAQNKIFRVSIQ